MSGISNSVFVVDDDPGIQQALKRLLGAAGLEVTSFDSGESLLASGAASNAGVFVLDVQLPGMSGFELHDFLRVECPATRSIFISGHLAPHQLERIRQAGSPCFSKPFPGQELIAVIRKILSGAGCSQSTPEPTAT